jgi:hypothetical protein
MSFSYKTLSSNDITLTSYITNKFWEVKNSTLSENGITIYIGENLPINSNNPFDPINDIKTSNEEYRRLIFDSIKHLYYKNYISSSLTGSFFQSSSYFNYEQSTLISGTLRELPNITGSANISYALNNQYEGATTVYDNISLYDEATFDPDRGNRIVIISIDQNIFGSGLSPNSVFISSSNYYLHDDGEGNFFDYYTQDNFLNPVSSSLVGNIFYSHGLIVITNEDYLCVFGAPPTVINDYYLYYNLNPTKSLEILNNDYSDCGVLLPESFTTHSLEGYTFPSFIYDDNTGIISIPPTQPNLIPGNYKIGYTIENNLGLTSNTASINLNITSEPLQIINIISSSICFNDTSSVPVTFSINYGVPYYSYSLDEGNTYLGINDLFNVIVSGSITASNINTIYAKDHLGEITTQTFSSWYPEVLASITIQKPPCSDTSTDGKIFINNDQTAISASINGVSQALPALFTNIPTGSITIGLTSSFGCTTSSIVEVDIYPPLTASVTQSNISCNGLTNGFLRINFSNVIDDLRVTLLDPTGSSIYNNKHLSEFPNNSVTASNLSTGSYDLSLFSLIIDQCQFYSNIFTITEPTTMSYSISASYINSCSNQILFNDVTGGTPPYTYITIKSSSGEIYSSNTTTVDLENLNGGTYISYIIDNNACQSFTSSLEIFGRQFIYSGSECYTGSITPFISILGFRNLTGTNNYSYRFITGDTSGSFDIYSQTSNDEITWGNTQQLSGSTSPQIIEILDTPPFYTRLFISNSLGEFYSNIYYQNS